MVLKGSSPSRSYLRGRTEALGPMSSWLLAGMVGISVPVAVVWLV
jgi:hypothetical protein